MLKEQLYNLPSFDRFVDSASKRGFTDSYAGTVLSRWLTAIDPTILEVKYPELTFLNSGIQADNTGGYAKRIQTLRIREQGAFRTAGDASDEKGKISLAAEDSTLKVLSREAESEWSEDEVREAELQNINLPSRYVQNHNKIYQREVDEIGYRGIEGNDGLANHAEPASDSASDVVSNLIGSEMYDEVASLIIDQWNGVNNTQEYMANRVDLPVRVFNYLGRTILDTRAGPQTVLTALRGNFPGVEFQGTFRLDEFTPSVTVAYNNNPEAMKMRLPVPLTVGEIVRISSFKYHVESHYRIAGLDLFEPSAVRYRTGL
jgi:hypothetical protein